MTPGIYYDVPAVAYHAAPGLSNSAMGLLARSPAHLHASFDEPFEATPAMHFGSVLHARVLEPDKAPFWAVEPEDHDGRTKLGKEWKRSVLETFDFILSADDAWAIGAMADAIRTHQTASQALKDGKAEVSIFVDDANGLRRKCRIDWVSAGNSLVDIKTTEDARPEAFMRSAVTFGYHRQAAWYLDTWNLIAPTEQRKEHFVFIAIEKKRPYALSVYIPTMQAIEYGRAEYARLSALYRECVKNDEWPGYPSDIQWLELPKWIKP